MSHLNRTNAKKGEAVIRRFSISSEEWKKITREQRSEPLFFCIKEKRNQSLNKVEQKWNTQVSK
jgi:hypothetical protein